MAVLLDTNILLRLLQPQHPHCALAERAVTSLHQQNQLLCLSAQNLIEFWCVVTRPVGENGLGLAIQQADAELDVLRHLFNLVPEAPLMSHWRQLVRKYRVSGKNTHDARLVAAMIVHGVESILTFNPRDFVRYSEIAVIDATAFA